MSLPNQIAKHFRDLHFGGSWTGVNFKDSIKDITWQQATTQVDSLNTIAKLVFHCNYYVSIMLKVLQGGQLIGSDKFSFDCPPINSQQDWDQLVNKAMADAEQFATLVEQLPESRLSENFADEKYGNYYRNLHGVIEHTHYHLGQINIIKKLIAQQS